MIFFDIVVARSDTERLIGLNNTIPWHLKSDLRWFQQLTLEKHASHDHNILIMGRRTWESLPKKPLPGRIHYIVSTTMKTPVDPNPNVYVFPSFTDALRHIRQTYTSSYPHCFVVGGGRLYREAIASYWCRSIYETVVHYTPPPPPPPHPSDSTAVYFPEIPYTFYVRTTLTQAIPDDECGLTYQRFQHIRKRPVLWWIDKTCYESDWLEHCLSQVPHYELQPARTVIPNAIVIANNLTQYRVLFNTFESTQTPFDLIHLSDEYLDDDYTCYNYASCRSVFRNYLSPLFLRSKNVHHFGIGYRNQLAICPTTYPSESQRPYVWSFAGYLKKSDRTLICDLFKRFHPYHIHETGGFNVGILSPKDYASILSQSKFVLCPVGNCSIDTFRLYEACEAGAIPVTLYTNVNQPFVRFIQNYWGMLFETDELPFIVSHSWEENTQRLKFYLEHPEAYVALQERCWLFWKTYKRALAQQFSQQLQHRHTYKAAST